MLHPHWKNFVSEFTYYNLKSVTYARKHIVPLIHAQSGGSIREAIGSHNFWFGIDETVDIKGNTTFIFVVGSLINRSTRFVLNVSDKDSKAAVEIYDFFEESLGMLYPMLPISNGKLFQSSFLSQVQNFK